MDRSPDETIDAQIRFAIAHRRLIHLIYGGSPRVVEPHDYGVMKGTAKLLVFQRRKASQRAEGWRFLEVGNITELTVQEATFPGSRARAGQQHHVWDVIYARVE